MHDRPLEDWEYPEPDEADDEEETSEVACPACGELVYDESERCPHCGDYLVITHSPLGGWPRSFVILGLFGIAAVILLLACQI